MWQNMQTIFLSIILESMPFVLLGVIVSSLIQEVIPHEKLLRVMPKSKKGMIFCLPLLGMFIPVCDCGVVPVARSLMQKGVPVPAAMAFILAAPVVNPLTMLATYAAFGMNPVMMWIRVGAAYSIAVLIGWILLVLRVEKVREAQVVRHHTPFKSLTVLSSSKRTFHETFVRILRHTLEEFFEVGVFVVISAAVSALLQTYMPSSIIASVGQHPIWSVVGMMFLAVVLSLCAQADAFVARSLAGLTTIGGIAGFLVIGQMIDIRNLFLLPRVFHTQVVILTFALTIIFTLCIGVAINFVGL
jgi:uncharacterized membrane protein YraQ (UPF0718 family)